MTTVAAALRGVCIACLLGTLTPGCNAGPGSHDSAASVTATDDRVPLPSDDWRHGDAVLLGMTEGAFHAVRRGDSACAWLGDQPRSFLWPSGWSVRFTNPIALLDSD